MTRRLTRRSSGRRARRVLALASACAATGLLLPATGAVAAPATTATTATTTPSRPPRVVDRSVTDSRINESSGLLVSRALNGVYWTFNDSGGQAVLYGIGRKGTVVATLEVAGVNAVDWEAATMVRDGGGRPAVAIADIGDNAGRRTSVTISVVREPTALGTTRTAPLRTITLTYPDQPTDAEAIFADPETGRLYIVTKGLLGGRLYAVPRSAWPGPATASEAAVAAVLEEVAQVPLVMVTDGVALPDGRVALRTYGELAVMPPVASLDGDDTWTPLATTTLPRQGQGEGLSLTSNGTFLLSTEGVGRPILRFVAPAAVVDARPATPTPSTTPVGADGAAGRGPSASGAAALGAVGVAVVFAVAAAVAFTRRRRT